MCVEVVDEHEEPVDHPRVVEPAGGGFAVLAVCLRALILAVRRGEHHDLAAELELGVADRAVRP